MKYLIGMIREQTEVDLMAHTNSKIKASWRVEWVVKYSVMALGARQSWYPSMTYLLSVFLMWFQFPVLIPFSCSPFHTKHVACSMRLSSNSISWMKLFVHSIVQWLFPFLCTKYLMLVFIIKKSCGTLLYFGLVRMMQATLLNKFQNFSGSVL